MFGLRALKETQEHTHSFYAASANCTTDYPTLSGDIRADVVVVGGGFSGASESTGRA